MKRFFFFIYLYEHIRRSNSTNANSLILYIVPVNSCHSVVYFTTHTQVQFLIIQNALDTSGAQIKSEVTHPSSIHKYMNIQCIYKIRRVNFLRFKYACQWLDYEDEMYMYIVYMYLLQIIKTLNGWFI